MVLGKKLIQNRKISMIDSSIKTEFQAINKWLQWFESMWNLNRHNYYCSRHPNDDVILFAVYFAACTASGSMKLDVLKKFSQLHFNYEWWKTCFVLEKVFHPIIKLASFCMSH